MVGGAESGTHRRHLILVDPSTGMDQKVLEALELRRSHGFRLLPPRSALSSSVTRAYLHLQLAT